MKKYSGIDISGGVARLSGPKRAYVRGSSRQCNISTELNMGGSCLSTPLSSSMPYKG